MFRSLLFVPGDRPERFAKAMDSAADVVIVDLEDSVHDANKPAARKHASAWLGQAHPKPVYVRVNPLASKLISEDLDCVLAARPDGLVLPKAEGAADIERLAARMHGASLPILPIATETPRGVFELGSYRKVSPLLCGLTWGAEDLPAAIGAISARNEDGTLTPPYEWLRSALLFAAHAAAVPAIETVFPNFRDLNGLGAYAACGRRDGFTAMLAIHPSQCDIINEAFTPTQQEIQAARRIVAAFEENPGVGVLQIDGKMVDLPHLKQAAAVLERARRFAD